MKKLILIKTTLLFVLFANAQIVNIPDANFKTYLVGNSSINTNLDTEIQVSEANNFGGVINANYKNIANLTGIEVFINIHELHCVGNQLTTLNISNNTLLTILDCGSNQLSSLNVSNNVNLIDLECEYNQISTLNVNNISNLSELKCYNNR